MKTHKPAIVVAAFNRTESLQRILKSIDNAHYQYDDIPLIISIDKSDVSAVAEIANNFNWRFGQKRVIAHLENLGLRKHILKCGDLTEEFGSIVMLEDDLLVSPHFYSYSAQALQAYSSEPRVAGISLYSHRYSESSFMRFSPIKDPHDTYFMQVPSSWGQVWTQEQWADFRTWYGKNYDKKIQSTAEVPWNVLMWPETSWKKYYFKYIIQHGLYFVYPYDSLSTNFADVGTHHQDSRTTLQQPLQLNLLEYKFPNFATAAIVYDSHCELTEKSFKRLCPSLKDYDVEIDLYGLKDVEQIKKKYILTSKTPTTPAVASYGLQLKPHEMNVAFNNPGSVFNLVETKTVANKQLELFDLDRNSYYFNIPSHFLIAPDAKNLTEDDITANGAILQEFYEYRDVKSQGVYKAMLPILSLERKIKQLLNK